VRAAMWIWDSKSSKGHGSPFNASNSSALGITHPQRYEGVGVEYLSLSIVPYLAGVSPSKYTSGNIRLKNL